MTDDEVLAKVFRRFLEDVDENNFVDVNPEDYPESGTIEGHLHLQPGESEVLDRIYSEAHK